MQNQKRQRDWQNGGAGGNASQVIVAAPQALLAPGAGATDQILALLLADHRSPQTKLAYQSDLRQFFAWQGDTDMTPAAVAAFCQLPGPELALLLNGYKAHLRARGRSEATVNRHLSSLRALLRMARRLGASCPDPAGLVTSEKVHAYRDTRGPALQAAAQVLAAVDRGTLKGKRDWALLLLLCENALRRGEITAANVADFEAGERRLSILGKGRGTQKEPVTLSEAATSALEHYLAARVQAAASELEPEAPLFVNASAHARGGRLTGKGVALVVKSYGHRVLGRHLHPHALRHMAITALLDATGGDVRSAQRLSRHSNLSTLQRYDDNREDLQGKATNLLSALLHARG